MSKVILESRPDQTFFESRREEQACQFVERHDRGMMSSPQSHSPTSLPSQESSELLCDSDSVGTRNEESVQEQHEYEERFRVDRRKLEQMLHGKNSLQTFIFLNTYLKTYFFGAWGWGLVVSLMCKLYCNNNGIFY